MTSVTRSRVPHNRHSTVSVHQMRAVTKCAESPLNSAYKLEAVEPHKIIIITRSLSRVFCKSMRQYCFIYISCIELPFCRCGWCGCEALQEALPQRHHAAQPLHYNSASFLVLQTVRPFACPFRIAVELFYSLSSLC